MVAGEGAFGVVHKASWRGIDVAVKAVKSAGISIAPEAQILVSRTAPANALLRLYVALFSRRHTRWCTLSHVLRTLLFC